MASRLYSIVLALMLMAVPGEQRNESQVDVSVEIMTPATREPRVSNVEAPASIAIVSHAVSVNSFSYCPQGLNPINRVSIYIRHRQFLI